MYNSLPSSLSTQVEVGSPRISHLLSFCCDAFTKEQLCNLECLVLVRLNFRLDSPTLAFFLDYYTNCIEATQIGSESTGGERCERMSPDRKTPRRCSNLARKVCELSLADYAFNKYPPSLTASCALRLACDLLKTEQGHPTTQSQVEQWGRFVDELRPQPVCARPSESPERSRPVSWGGHNHNLVQECRENLKLLVSLNQEALEVMSAM